mmetsp:Transcript_42493/g.85934  ORF Transcript_42493/g.85934 Transcript_42493/m.85934 type:complete len:378 (-) Transcript_42493:192-1325(-)
MRENQFLKLVGSTVVLVPYRKKFVKRYFEWMQDPWLREMTASDEVELSEEYKAQDSWCNDPKKLTFIVLDASVESAIEGSIKAAVGDVNLVIDNHDPTVAEIMVMIGEPSCRRRGFASAAVNLMIFFARSRLGIRRFFVKISASNYASLRLFEMLQFSKCGFSEVFQENELEYIVDAEADIIRPSELLCVRPFNDDDTACRHAPDGALLPVTTILEGNGKDVTDEPATISAAASPESELSLSAATPPLAAKCNYSKPLIKVETFSACVGDGITELSFFCQVVLLDGSCIVSLVGSDTQRVPEMGAMSVSMATRFDRMPLTSTLLGDSDEVPRSLSQHLARRTSMQCFVSSSLPDAAALFTPEIMGHIHSCIRSLQEG